MNEGVNRLRELYQNIHLKPVREIRAGVKGLLDADEQEFKTILAILEKEGCWIEHGWGTYLHLPNGECITLDYWNDEKDLTPNSASVIIKEE